MSTAPPATVVYRFEPTFLFLGGLILVCTASLGILLAGAMVLSARPQWEVLLLLTVCLGFFAGFGAYFYFRHRGAVAVREGRLFLVRGKQVRSSMDLAEIGSIRTNDGHIPPNVTLHSQSGQLVRFSRQLVNFPALINTLCAGSVGLSRSLTLPVPFELDARPAIRREIYGALGFLALLFYGIFFGSLWAHGNSEWIEGFSIISAIWLFMGSITGLLIIRPGEPARIAIEQNVLLWQTFLGGPQSIALSEISEIGIRESLQDVGDAGISAKKRTFPIYVEARAGAGGPARSIAVTDRVARAGEHCTATLYLALKNSLAGRHPKIRFVDFAVAATR